MLRFVDPGRVVRDVFSNHRPRPGDAYAVLVREPNLAQEVVHVTRITDEEWRELDSLQEQSTFLRSVAGAMLIPAGFPYRHSIITIVVRDGFAVFGRDESPWLTAWMFSNHFRSAFTDGVILVTEHGWTDFMKGLGGYAPSLRQPN